MNKKLLSILSMALTLCTVSTPSAADVKIFGVPARELVSSADIKMTITSKPHEIKMLNISNAGVKGKTGEFSNAPDARDCVKKMFAETPPRLVAGSFTIVSASARLGGSIVGKSQTTISAESFSFQPLTVFGTNGQFTLNFINPLSLIKSLTMKPSDITATHGGEELHIGSVWGKFAGITGDSIHCVGYGRVTVTFDLDKLAKCFPNESQNLTPTSAKKQFFDAHFGPTCESDGESSS